MLNEEERSSAWEYFNPLSVERVWGAYTRPVPSLVYGAWSSMASGRGVLLPGFLPRKIGTWGREVAGSVLGFEKWHPLIRKPIGAVMFGETFGERRFGTVGSILDRYPGRSYSQGVWRELRAGQTANRFRGLGGRVRRGAGFYMGTSEAVAARQTAETLLSPAFRATAAGIRLARIVNPIMNVVAVGQLAYMAAETLYKGVRATVDTIDRASVRAGALEMGGDLSQGFLTQQAATERQRAMMAIQSSELAGRRFMGNEASFYGQ